MKERHGFDLIILSDRSLLVDVAVVHPAAPSRRLVALAAARDIENVKAAKYRSVALERGAAFTAFIVESYGALGGQGLDCSTMLNHAPASPFELSERVVAETLSVALQRGNVFISHTRSLAARAQAVSGRDARATQSTTDTDRRKRGRRQ